MTARSKLDGRDVEWNDKISKWVYSDDGKSVAGEQKEIEKKMFNEKAMKLHEEFKALAEKFKIGFIASIYFKEEDFSGVHVYGKINHVEELGLSKAIEQKFIA